MKYPVHMHLRNMLRDRVKIYSVFKDSYLCMCNESDLEHFSFVVNIVVNVFVETVPRKYSCVFLGWKIQTLCHVYARVWQMVEEN